MGLCMIFNTGRHIKKGYMLLYKAAFTAAINIITLVIAILLQEDFNK